MRRILTLSICAALSVSVGALIASDARAGAFVCNNPNPIVGGTFGNIVVPEEATCILQDATVNGNIEQQSGSQLYLIGVNKGVTVNGNISSQGGQFTSLTTGADPIEVVGNVDIESNIGVVICGAHIYGNVAISNLIPGGLFLGATPGTCQGAPAEFTTGPNIIGGNVSIANNDSGNFFVGYNTVGKNMSITDNKGGEAVFANKVTGNLTCSDNAPPFFISTSPPLSNQAKKLIGQCAPSGGLTVPPTLLALADEVIE